MHFEKAPLFYFLFAVMVAFSIFLIVKFVKILHPVTPVEYVHAKYLQSLFANFWYLTTFAITLFFFNRKLLRIIKKIRNGNSEEFTKKEHKFISRLFKVSEKKTKLIAYSAIVFFIIGSGFLIYLLISVSDQLTPPVYDMYRKVAFSTISQFTIILVFIIIGMKLRFKFRRIIEKLRD